MTELVSRRLLLIATTISCLYITLSLACDPIAFRLVSIKNFTVSGSIFIYPALYTLLDILTRLIGRNNTIILILVFHLCDLIFSYLLFSLNLLPAPTSFHHLSAFNTVLTPLPRMFWAGIVGAIIAGIVEVIIYSFLQSKLKSFLLASFFSTLLVLLFHDVPTDIIAFKKIFPHQYLRIAGDNFLIVVSVLLVYTVLGSIAIKLIKSRQNSNNVIANEIR